MRVDRDDLAGQDVAHRRRAHDVEGARLRREHEGIAEPAHHQRTPPMLVARGEQRVADDDDQRKRPLDAGQCLGQLLLGLAGARLGDAVHHDFAVHARREDGPVGLELAAQLHGVGEVAVVGQRDVPATEAHEHRLRVLDGAGARRGVARVADGGAAMQAGDALVVESVGDEAHLAHGLRRAVIVHGDNAGRLLSAMLQRVQAEVRDVRRVRM